MTFTLIANGKERTVNPIAERMPGGGWKCRCGDRVDGLHDIFAHIKTQHNGVPSMDPRGDVYDLNEIVTPEDARKAAAI